jgi:hypothetical protein
MKIPASLTKVSVAVDYIPKGPYPPLGFVPFWEAELGNGDYLGLYWPFGKEKEEPIICDMSHDDWSLIPGFSTLDKFLEWYELNDQDRGENEVDDPDFVVTQYALGREALKKNDHSSAIMHFENCTKILPEVSEYWYTLSSQNYAFMMLTETNAFQERYNFNLDAWQNEFTELCILGLESDRIFSV